MRPIKITEDCIIYNDMENGWVRGKGQPRWHLSLYSRWKHMWVRCKDPSNPRYENYKDCEIDERYRLFSNYIDDVMQLENFDKLCEDPFHWDIDKDKIDPENRCYFFEHLSIISNSENTRERNKRYDYSDKMKPIIGVNIDDGSVLIFNSVNEAREKDFKPPNIRKCLKGELNSYKRYKWYYLDDEKISRK